MTATVVPALSPTEVAALEAWAWGQLARCMAAGRRARALRLAAAHLAGITDDPEIRVTERERIARIDRTLGELRRDYALLAAPDPEAWLDLLARRHDRRERDDAA